LIRSAHVIIYAGSLINRELLKDTRAELFDSSKLDLDEIVGIMVRATGEGKTVVRLHSGDPSIYGAIGEQMERLREEGIPYEVVPGVSSVFAGAARIGIELTVPELTQTVILTRAKGRTPVPDRESLSSLSSHGATMVIFLSAGLRNEVQEELLTYYSPDTPVAVVQRATWPDERIFFCNLEELSKTIEEAHIEKTALIYVGKAVAGRDLYLRKTSRLYNKEFEHGYRKK
ncbi:MAG: precorrin-4 C(11)-methyltransferase, partial [Desulfatiglandales bacterium]